MLEDPSQGETDLSRSYLWGGNTSSSAYDVRTPQDEGSLPLDVEGVLRRTQQYIEDVERFVGGKSHN